ncbi:MAG TPA: diguanylate cyclase [Treponemataceae bacterium]|nr:diguanylate cyclase [Treponemataceae bacterium]
MVHKTKELLKTFNSEQKIIEYTRKEESKSLFELFFETIPDATMVISHNEFELFNCNHEFELLTGYSKTELLGTPLKEISLFKINNLEKYFSEVLKGSQKPQSVSLELQLLDGSKYYGLISSAIILIDNTKYILSIIKNNTEQKVLENKLRHSEEMHRLLADNASDVIWIMDLTGAFSYISPSVEKLRGFTVEEIMNQTQEELLCPSSRIYLEKGLEASIYAVQNNLPFIKFRGDMEQPCKDGSTVWTDLSVSGIFDKNHQFKGLLGVSRDISERRAMENEIRRLTEIDSLTQLYNRFKSDTVLKAEIERTQRSSSIFSIIMLDIDNFKKVNDAYGHTAGDEVLKGIARIIRSNIRKIDTAARWGGEEILIIIPETDILGAQNLSEKLLLKISEHSFPDIGHITASFGAAEYENGITEAVLVSRADKAMYEAKDAGKNCVRVYQDKENMS